MKAGRPSLRPENKNKISALKIAAEMDDYLSGPTKSSRYDIDIRLKRTLKNLSAATMTADDFHVYEKMLLTEALLDLFDKYMAGEGNYRLADHFNWSRES